MRSALLANVLVLAGCRTIATHEVSSAPLPDVRVGERARCWDVVCSGERVGVVVLFQHSGRVRDSVYVVRNPWQQDLGIIDGLGRAYRYVPHEEEPAWVGSGTVAAGAQRILGASTPCELIETAVAAPPHESTATRAPAPSAEPLPDGGLPQSR